MPNLNRNTLCKAERLCSQKLIDDVFCNGHRLLVFPFSVRWMVMKSDEVIIPRNALSMEDNTARQTVLNGAETAVSIVPINRPNMGTDSAATAMSAQILVATSKRKFHCAVDRNRVKRLMRECFRLRKPELYDFLENHGISLIVTVNYIHNVIFDYHLFQSKFDKLFKSLLKEIEKNEEGTRMGDD